MNQIRIFCTQLRCNLNSKKKFLNTNLRQWNNISRRKRLCMGPWMMSWFFKHPKWYFKRSNTTIPVHKGYLRVTPLIKDCTPLKYNAIFNEETSNSSLKSTFFKTQETLNGTKNLKPQAIQTPSHFINKEILETLPITTKQNIFPNLPTLTTPHNKNNTLFPPTNLQSTVKRSVVPKYSHMDYQINRPITK